MSIDPVTNITSVSEAQSLDSRLNVDKANLRSFAQRGWSATDSGTRPKQEIHGSPSSARSPEMTADEIQVQQDRQTHGRIVIRYLDHAGDVILQVPSAQVLGLQQAIEQALEQQAKLQTENNQAIDEGATTDGH
ncbi:MAG TPA: hypothetical protein VGS27_15045 [Candidatus Sulfotelmatobacter sp.]|nr:hypothetical protein [Candidatus Sulfotelmatobacter sp.]